MQITFLFYSRGVCNRCLRVEGRNQLFREQGVFNLMSRNTIYRPLLLQRPQSKQFFDCYPHFTVKLRCETPLNVNFTIFHIKMTSKYAM